MLKSVKSNQYQHVYNQITDRVHLGSVNRIDILIFLKVHRRINSAFVLHVKGDVLRKIRKMGP